MDPARYFLLNRALQVGGDGWIHIVPKGELANADAGIVQVLDDEALVSILSNIEEDRDTLGDRWPGIYVGREHHVYDAGQDSAALGWFKEFEKRADGIWAKADGLNANGREAIANAEYKFTSFVADRKDTEPLGGGRVRILKIDTIGFTNLANGKDLLTPITNRQPASLPATPEPDPSALSPRAAGDAFSKLVNRVKAERGWNFYTAWNHCRTTHAALFNRMSGDTGLESKATVPASASQARVSTFDFAQAAGEALRGLASDEQAAHGSTFSEAWARVTNRRSDLLRFCNREGSPADWARLDSQAFSKFYSGLKLGPDGKRIVVVSDSNRTGQPNKNSSRTCFERTYDAVLRREPDLSPAECWRRVREEFPQVFWPFVALTAAKSQ